MLLALLWTFIVVLCGSGHPALFLQSNSFEFAIVFGGGDDGLSRMDEITT